MKKNVLRVLFVLFVFSASSFLYAFEPRQYVIEEIKHIAQRERLEYSFYVGLISDQLPNTAQRKSESEIIDMLIQATILMYDETIGKDGLPVPRNIGEAKFLARADWEHVIYISMTNDIIVREKRN